MVGELGVVAAGYCSDVLVVDADPSVDITVLQDRRHLAAVISRGECVDLDTPWPDRRLIPGEKVSNWSGAILTYERALGRG